ncbi:MAG: hypothetical protein RL134_1018 [Actinomycetota bacterium]
MAQTDYRVRARSKQGKLVEQKIKASSEGEAASRVQQLGLVPISIEPLGKGLNREIRFGAGKVKTKDLAIFARQFSTMLASGLPILRCLSILSQQTESTRLRELLDQMRVEVEKGSALSETMAQRKEFPPLMVSMTRAGEVGGFLDSTMRQIATSLEADVKLRGRIKAALTYPVAVGVIAVLIVTGMLIFVVPVFASMFDSFGGTLPLPTQVLVTLSNLIKDPRFFVPLLAAIVIGVFLYRRNARNPRLRAVVDPLKFKIPVFGSLLKKVAIARFTRNLSSLLAAGVPILTSLDIVADTSGNAVIANAVGEVKESVRQGSGIAKPLEAEGVFPDMVVQMISVGESTGSLDEMLARIADFYDQEVEATTEQLTALIEPIMIVVLGGVVGAMIIALYLPIFSIFDLIK